MGKEQHDDRSSLFWETEIFDEKPGSEVQIRMAKALVDIIGQDRPLTRDDFRKIERPLSLGFRVAEDSVMTQENLIRGAMRRFVNILALVAAEGDEGKAAELMGSSEHHQGLPKLTGRIREITKPAEARGQQVRGTKPEKPEKPQKSRSRILYEQWIERGKPVTVKPPPKRD